MKVLTLLTIAGCLLAQTGMAQRHSPVTFNGIQLSAIKGSSSKPDTIILPAKKNGRFVITGADKTYFTLLSTGKYDAQNSYTVVCFMPPDTFTGIARATLTYSEPGKKSTAVALTGLCTKGLEGENEPTLAVVTDALGYAINLGWTTLANHTKPVLQGDELPYALFRKAGKGSVQMLPVARYSPDFELPFGYYIISPDGPVKKQAGILAKSGTYVEHQALYPALSNGSTTFDPGNTSFGFYATGPKHTGYSEDCWNMLLHPADAVHATRIYAVKDKQDKPLSCTYLLCFEEAKNGDYNDYVFLVTNVTPVTDNGFTTIFNGRDLNGWHLYMKGKGMDTDPEKNFTIENNMLHVRGKELGYAITQESYHNFHLSVDFKWGEQKWPPRENEKRDAGICYNIPAAEPDSIWPQSIECQIQEGDAGDFWLLSGSTIEVEGKKNVPSNHTRIVKKKDAERKYGEWNTVEVISYNGRCIHIVNGEVVNAGDNASIKDGRLLLQSEYAEIYYRNIRVRKL